MAMSKEELKERIEKINIKIEKINNRITKWSSGMNTKGVEVCKRILNVQPNTEESNICYKEYRILLKENERNPEYVNSDLFTPPQLSELYKAYSDLRDSNITKQKYLTQLEKIINFESKEKIQILVEFLNKWKEDAKTWYIKNAKLYIELDENKINAYEEYKKEHYYDSAKESQISYLYYFTQSFNKQYYERIDKFTMEITDTYRKTIDEQRLDKMLNDEANAKYEDLVNRITYITGVIIDVSNLHIAGNGNLNGFVIGEKGKAKVETIGCGGYNIQCFHYRTLINEIK